MGANARFADSHSATLSEWEGRRIAPDVVLVDDLATWLPVPNKQTSFFDRPIEGVGVMLEFKLDGETSDPFSDEDATTFELEPKDRKDPKGQTLGQICAYATAHMANQFRSHVFSVLVFRDYARILRWDRAGVVVTEKIYFAPVTVHPLAEFFYRYAGASAEARGVDPNTMRLGLFDPALTTAIKETLDTNKNGPFYKVTIHKSNLASTKSYIIAAPQFMATASPTGRSTRTFKAYDMETREYVFMKDSWRILTSALKPEHETYAALAAAGVHHIPTVITYEDMHLQRTKTCLDLKKDTKRADKTDKFRKFQHYRLVLKEFARPLEQFKDVRQLMDVFSDAIQGNYRILCLPSKFQLNRCCHSPP